MKLIDMRSDTLMKLLDQPEKSLAELDAEVAAGAKERGLVNVKGHRLTGGMRASIYNAMPVEGVRALAEYMKGFEVEHHA